MNRLNTRFFATCSLALTLSLAAASLSEARPGGAGGGRSFGFRGSRGFSTPSSPSRYQGGNQQQSSGFSNSQQPNRPMGTFGNSIPSGSFTRGLMGGLAGGMIGSMLFRGMGYAGTPGGFGGGIGLFEIIVLIGLGYLAYRFVLARRLGVNGPQREMTHYERISRVEPGPFASPGSSREDNEHACASTLGKYDHRFDLTAFKEELMDSFVKVQAAWNLRDLSSLSDSLAPELKNQLDADVAQLKARGRMNRIENIAVRNTELVEAWEEYGQEYATLRFRASLLDYTLDESTGQVVAGDKVQPVKFEENWTFVRKVGQTGTPTPWKLTAIEG